MKRNFKKLVSLVLVFAMSVAIAVPGFAASSDASVSERLEPYQQVINKVNQNLGSTTYIPTGSEEKVYENIKNMSLAEFETMLRKEYKDFLASNTEKQMVDDSVIVPYSVVEDFYETYPVSYNSSMYLQATVFSGTGAAGSFSFQSIDDWGTAWPGNDGYHFQVDYRNSSATLSSDKKKCVVSLTGIPADPNGLALTVTLHANHTFTAN